MSEYVFSLSLVASRLLVSVVQSWLFSHRCFTSESAFGSFMFPPCPWDHWYSTIAPAHQHTPSCIWATFFAFGTTYVATGALLGFVRYGTPTRHVSECRGGAPRYRNANRGRVADRRGGS